MRAKMVQSGRYKQYKRYMRNHGPDRMTFDDSWCFYLKIFRKNINFSVMVVFIFRINFQSFQKEFQPLVFIFEDEIILQK